MQFAVGYSYGVPPGFHGEGGRMVFEAESEFDAVEQLKAILRASKLAQGETFVDAMFKVEGISTDTQVFKFD